MHISRINISHIDFNDDTFSLVPPFISSQVPASLLESVRRCGILHPPIVKEKSASSFVIVAGRKRLYAATQATGAASCDCHKVTDQTAPIEVLAICLEEALLSGPLTPIQRAVFFRKALALQGEQEVAARFLPLLGLAPSPYHLRRDLRLLELEEPLVSAIHAGILDDKVAYELGRLSFSDRLALFEVIDTLHLSVGNQKKLAITCRELAQRHNTTISDLLHSPEVDDIINFGEANVPQKTAGLMKWLTTARFPRLSRAEKEFQHFVAGLALPAQATLTHSPAFEKDELFFTLTCADRDQLTTIWQTIRDLIPADQQRKTNS